ncbi:MAG: SPOR domain-containing protein [Pseudomonadota bacterium]
MGVPTRSARTLASWMLVGAVLCAPAAAVAQAVVQPVPSGASQALNLALNRLGRDPRDLGAMIDAGNAALLMGDVDAAIGFFARADQISPNNSRVKAGLAGALVRSENPYDAIPLFAEAERAGGIDPALAADRGLAYDLVGDNATAQRYYRQALGVASNDETLRRLAVSQAIAGDRTGMETTLTPLLVRQDKAAWRTRAFALSILGRPEEAVAIANQTMPPELAGGVAPYLRYMIRLTPAQQAAAANFGRFPRAADIGRDDPRVARYALPKRVAGADLALVPAGEPLDKDRSRRAPREDRRRQAEPPRFAGPPATVPAASSSAGPPPEPFPARQSSAPPPLASSQTAPYRAAGPVTGPVYAAPSDRSRITSSTGPSVNSPATAARPAVAPGAGTLARPASTYGPRVPGPAAVSAVAATPRPLAISPPPRPTTFVAAQPPAALPQPVPPARAMAAVPSPIAPASTASASLPARTRRVADAFSGFDLPRGSAAPAAGAVDIRKIVPARAKAAEPPKPIKPINPSRYWVQVGTGRNPGAMSFTWRALTKGEPELFRGKVPFVTDWGRTNRLLTGPFATEVAAAAWLAKARKAGLDAFVWTSPAGQAVDSLPS